MYVLLHVRVFFLEEVSLYAVKCHFDYLYVRKSHLGDPNMQNNILRNSISLPFLYYSYLVLSMQTYQEHSRTFFLQTEPVAAALVPHWTGPKAHFVASEDHKVFHVSK